MLAFSKYSILIFNLCLNCFNLVDNQFSHCINFVNLVKLIKFLYFYFFKSQKPLEDDGEFVYCLPRKSPKALYNPYDLQVVSAHTAKHCKEFWVITASFISKVMFNGCFKLSELQYKNIIQCRI